jgi:hypothetical protein
MDLRRVGGIVIAVLVGLGVYFAWPKEKLSPEDEIRALVARMIRSAEKRDAAGVADGLSEAFSGQGMGKREVKQLALGQFFGAKQIVVLNPLLDVTVKSPTSGSFKGSFLFGRDGAEPSGSRYEIEAQVQRDDGEWRIVSASWTR